MLSHRDIPTIPAYCTTLEVDGSTRAVFNGVVADDIPALGGCTASDVVAVNICSHCAIEERKASRQDDVPHDWP